MIGVLMKGMDQGLLNKMIALTQTGKKCCLFSGSPLLSEVPALFPVFQPLRAYHFEGTLVSTDMSTTEMLSKLVLPKKKYFYVRSLEWTMLQNCDYNYLKSIYQNDSIELIAANKEIFEVLKKLFKEPVGISEDLDLEEI
tara:strand:+ start:26856 stop:27275 length:420 start_codon:yes stop_codon:yes gene_type:complete